MTDTRFYLIGGMVTLLLGCIFLMLLAGCSLGKPNRKDFASEDCYTWAYCMYVNQKNVDKSACMGLSDECRQALKDGRMKK